MKNLAIINALSAVAISLAVSYSSTAAAESVNQTSVRVSDKDTQTITVHYQASDLATQQGVLKLHSQIKRAAKTICGPTNARKAGSLSAAARNSECYDQAMQVAVNRIDLLPTGCNS